jgi:MerR family transcriptional regulator, thiopeptide resistance regulator
VTADTRTWRIGELAEAAGLTVRTLHHYDQIGLLCPSRRSVGGHRLYGGADARRLYQIVALRGLGLQLGQIRECLGAELDPRPLVAEQLRGLTAQLEAGERLRSRLVSLLQALDRHEQPAGGDLLDLIQQTAEVGHLVTGYLTAEQIARLARRHEELGQQAVQLVRDELPELYRRALAEFQAGTDASDPAVRLIVERIDRASATLSGGDEETTTGVRRMWAERGEKVYPGAGIPWGDLADYLDRARTTVKAPGR